MLPKDDTIKTSDAAASCHELLVSQTNRDLFELVQTNHRNGSLNIIHRSVSV